MQILQIVAFELKLLSYRIGYIYIHIYNNIGINDKQYRNTCDR